MDPTISLESPDLESLSEDELKLALEDRLSKAESLGLLSPDEAFQFKSQNGLLKEPSVPDLPSGISIDIPGGDPTGDFLGGVVSGANPIEMARGLASTAYNVGNYGIKSALGSEMTPEELQAGRAATSRIAGGAAGALAGSMVAPGVGTVIGGLLGDQATSAVNRQVGLEPPIENVPEFIGQQVGGIAGGAALGQAGKMVRDRAVGLPKIRQIRENIRRQGGVAPAVMAQMGLPFSSIDRNVVAYEKSLPAINTLLEKNFFGGSKLNLDTLTFEGPIGKDSMANWARLNQVESALTELGPIKSTAIDKVTDTARLHNLQALPTMNGPGNRIIGFDLIDLDSTQFAPQSVGGVSRYKYPFQEKLVAFDDVVDKFLGSDQPDAGMYIETVKNKVFSELGSANAGFITPSEVQSALKRLNESADMVGLWDENALAKALRDGKEGAKWKAMHDAYPLLRNALQDVMDMTLNEIQQKVPPTMFPADATPSKIGEYNKLYSALKVAEDDLRSLRLSDSVSTSNRGGASLVPNPAEAIIGGNNNLAGVSRGYSRAIMESLARKGLGTDPGIAKQNMALARLGETIPQHIIEMQREKFGINPAELENVPLATASAMVVAQSQPRIDLPATIPSDTSEIEKYAKGLNLFTLQNPSHPATPMINELLGAKTKEEAEIALSKIFISGVIAPEGEQYGYKALVNGKITNMVDYETAARAVDSIKNTRERYDAMVKLRTKLRPPKSSRTLIQPVQTSSTVEPTAENPEFNSPEPMQKKDELDTINENMKD